MNSIQRRYSKEEFARRGDALYEHQIRPRLQPADHGQFAAIDIETGEYEVTPSEMEASHRLRARVPDAQIWMVRIGSRAVHRFGCRGARSSS